MDIDISFIDSIQRLKLLFECRVELLVIFTDIEKSNHLLEMQELIQEGEEKEWDIITKKLTRLL